MLIKCQPISSPIFIDACDKFLQPAAHQEDVSTINTQPETRRTPAHSGRPLFYKAIASPYRFNTAPP
jgi:hypothetical protein